MNKASTAIAKELDYYMSLPYPVMLYPPDDEDERWFASIPELDSCTTCADTREETLEMIEDAKLTRISGRLEYGDSIPEPTRR